MEVVKGCTLETARLSNKLYQLKLDNILTDITIICHGKVINAHKCVLAASSQFFKTLFCQDSTYMCGYFQSCDFTDQLESSAAAFLELIVDFMYSRTILLNDVNVAEVAKLAFFFVIDDLLETCYQFINSAVQLKNSLDLYSRLNQVAEFRAGPVYLQTLDKSIDLLKEPLSLIQSRFHDLYIQSEALVNAKSDDIIQLVSKGVAKACTIDGVVKFVIRWLQKHPRDDGFEVASLLLDFALEKSRTPLPGTVSSWAHIPYIYEKIEAVLYGSNMSQAYQTGLLTKMSAILEQLESHDYHVIKEQELNAEKEMNEVKDGEKESSENDKDKNIEVVTDVIKAESESKEEKTQQSFKKLKKDVPRLYHLRKQKTQGNVSKRVSCKICKLEFREKYQLSKHIKRVHSKTGKISLKISISKSSIKKKPGKRGRPKLAGSIKDKVKTDDGNVNYSEKESDMPNQNSYIQKERKQKKAAEGENPHADSKQLNINNCNETGVEKFKSDDGEAAIAGIRKTIQGLSDLDEEDHDSDSTIENQPLDLNDKIDAFDAENSLIDSGVDQATVDKILGDLMPFRCSLCSEIFASKKLLKLHHCGNSDIRKFSCKTCDMTFKHSSNLRRHEQTHTGQKTLECFVCQTKFANISALRDHLKTHSADRPFSCDVCQRAYKDERDFIRHSMLHSQADKLFKCEVCEKQFTRKYHLTRHTLIHQGKIPRKHKCPHCNESFSRTKALQKHLPTHNGEPGVNEVYEAPSTSHACEVCGYVFQDVNNLIRHIRVHTGEKPFGCDICSKAFSQKGQLNIHKLTHGGKRQYQCEMCPKLFLTNSGLHKHRRQVHSNYRPYRCEYCGKQFLQKSDLRRHTPMHTGEKNFQCDICAQCFARKDKLVTHFKQEHMQELK